MGASSNVTQCVLWVRLIITVPRCHGDWFQDLPQIPEPAEAQVSLYRVVRCLHIAS